jgi:hypothetical protein
MHALMEGVDKSFSVETNRPSASVALRGKRSNE